MATFLTIDPGANGRTGALPVASLELYESADSVRDPRALHLDLETTIQVLDGVVYVATEDDESALTPGDVATIPAGTSYRRWNAGEDEARWLEVYCSA